jgi:dipeptidase E
VGLKNLKGLGLVPFEFFPHYQDRVKLRAALSRYSRRSPLPIVAAGDGGGVVLEGELMTVVGRAELFLGGMQAQLSRGE